MSLFLLVLLVLLGSDLNGVFIWRLHLYQLSHPSRLFLVVASTSRRTVLPIPSQSALRLPGRQHSHTSFHPLGSALSLSHDAFSGHLFSSPPPSPLSLLLSSSSSTASPGAHKPVFGPFSCFPFFGLAAFFAGYFFGVSFTSDFLGDCRLPPLFCDCGQFQPL